MMATARHGAVGLLESESGENDGGPRPAPAGQCRRWFRCGPESCVGVLTLNLSNLFEKFGQNVQIKQNISIKRHLVLYLSFFFGKRQKVVSSTRSTP